MGMIRCWPSLHYMYMYIIHTCTCTWILMCIFPVLCVYWVFNVYGMLPWQPLFELGLKRVIMVKHPLVTLKYMCSIFCLGFTCKYTLYMYNGMLYTVHVHVYDTWRVQQHNTCIVIHVQKSSNTSFFTRIWNKILASKQDSCKCQKFAWILEQISSKSCDFLPRSCKIFSIGISTCTYMYILLCVTCLHYRHWNQTMYRHTYTSGLTWYLATSNRGRRQRKRTTYSIPCSMKEQSVCTCTCIYSTYIHCTYYNIHIIVYSIEMQILKYEKWPDSIRIPWDCSVSSIGR